MIPFRTLLAIALLMMLALNGCLDIPERCGMDYEMTEYELWSLDLNDFSTSEAYRWEARDMYDGYSTRFEIYGISPDESSIYYTDDHTSSNVRLYKLSLNDRSTQFIKTFEDSRDFTLSPSGNLLAFQKESTVWISDVNGENQQKLLERDSLQYFGAPKWYLNDDKVIVAHSIYDRDDDGLWLLDIPDSTYRVVSNISSYDYDTSIDGSRIVLQDYQQSGPSLIRYKNLFSDNLITLHEGTSPLFINNGSSVVFEKFDGLYISDLNGELNKIHNKQGVGGSLSRNGKVSVSPNSQTLAYSDQEGLYIYQAKSSRVMYTLNSETFLPSNMQSWSSINIDLFEIIFSSDNETVYFMMKRHFFSDGC